MHQLLVATRKGLMVVEGQGDRANWRITAHHFKGEPVTHVLADPRDGTWYAALRMGHFGVKLRKSTDEGCHVLIQRQPIRFVLFELFGVAGIFTAKIAQISHRILGRFNSFAKRLNGLTGLLQPLAGFV